MPAKKPKKKAIAKRKVVVRVVPKTRAAPKAKPKGYAPGLLGGIGSTIGSFFGGPALGSVGKKAGDWLGRITGMGAYRVRKNTIATGAPPVFANAGGVTVAHREYLQDITSSTAFNLQSFPINPGVSGTFPWLSSLANNFEQYEMLGLVFEFRSTSADALNSTNTALGVVVAATEYDTVDANFANKIQMEAYQYSTSCAPSQSMIHPVECDPRQNTLREMYVRSGAVPSGSDPRFYDLGNFQIATQGMQAASVVGELWVSYHVRFYKPRLPLTVSVSASAYHADITATTSYAFNTVVPHSGNTLAVQLNSPTSNYVTLPAVGRYLFLCSLQGTGVGINPTLWSNLTNCSVVAAWHSGTETSSVSGSGTNATTVAIVFEATQNGATFSYAAPQTISAGTPFGDLFVTALPAGLDVKKLSLDDRMQQLEDMLSRSVLVDSHSMATPGGMTSYLMKR